MKPKMCSVSKPSSALARAGASAMMHATAVHNLKAATRIPYPIGACWLDAAAALTGLSVTYTAGRVRVDFRERLRGADPVWPCINGKATAQEDIETRGCRPKRSEHCHGFDGVCRRSRVRWSYLR